MSDPDDEDAADGSPLHTPAASSVFTSWMKPGTTPPAAHDEDTEQDQGADAPTTNPTTTGEEETMATRTKKAGARRARKANSGGSPQLQICSALLQGDLSREAIAEACSDLTAPQISSALNNSKNAGRIVFIEGDQVYRITKEGKAWVASATGEQPAAKAKPKKRGAAGRSKAHSRKRAATADKATTPPPDEGGPTFRCGVMSDGAFFITKDEVSIELDAAEHKQMLHYLERMAETA